jgi:hypothetical protein
MNFTEIIKLADIATPKKLKGVLNSIYARLSAIDVEDFLSLDSENPVQNKVITDRIYRVEDRVTFLEEVGGSDNIIVDEILSLDSTHPVQNKVITNKFNFLESSISLTNENVKENSDGITALTQEITTNSQDITLLDERVKTLEESGVNITVDTNLNLTSDNPIANSVVAREIDALDSYRMGHDADIDLLKGRVTNLEQNGGSGSSVSSPVYTIVSGLFTPTEDMLGKAYLVRNDNPEGDGDMYDEYTVVEFSAPDGSIIYEWEKIGSASSEEVTGNRNIFVDVGGFDSLPNASVDTLGKIYLVRVNNEYNYEDYEEYITILEGYNEGNIPSYGWEKLGTVNKEDISGNIVVDTVLDANSDNPVANSAVTSSIMAIDERLIAVEENGGIVDTALDINSNNAVANSAVTSELTRVDTRVEEVADMSYEALMLAANNEQKITALEEGVYELIEKVIADGTQPSYTFESLNLNRAIVKVYLPETSKTTEANFITGSIYTGKNTGGAYSASSYTFGNIKDNTSNKYAFISLYQNHGWWESEVHEFVTGIAYANIKKFAFNLFKYDVNTYTHINQVIVGGYSSMFIPEGVEIELWGVRNNEDLG